MKNINLILFDDAHRVSLLPFTFTRPCADIRVGIVTIAEKWQQTLSVSSLSYRTESYLQTKYPLHIADNNYFINGRVCPDEELVTAILQLETGKVLMKGELLIAIKLAQSDAVNFELIGNYPIVNYANELIQISYPEDIFRYNDVELRKDFERITRGRKSSKISATNVILGDDFFAEEGVDAECSTFNTKTGPIYLGKNSAVLEGTHIRGSFALCHDSQVKMGSKIYGATTIGPFSRVGGEINESVIWGYSNKGHEGYLGNSVLGQWCNIGADSNNSNLKNNYEAIKLWDYSSQRFRKTGMQFCGLMMGDHAKCGINTMFNTGTVVGVSANVFGSGFPRNFVPDFAWGGSHGFETYTLEKVFATAEKVFERRKKDFNLIEQDILKHIFSLTEGYRRF